MAQRNTGAMLWAPLAAGLVGAGVALLFAPRSGKDTREKIVRSTREAKGRARDNLRSTRESLDTGIEQGKELEHRFAKALKRGSQATRQELDNVAEEYPNTSAITKWEEEM